MSLVEITGEEQTILRGYMLDAPSKTMKLKATALMMLDQDVPVDAISQIVDRRPSTIKTWAREFYQARLASLDCGYLDNINASKLTAKQRAEALEILAKPPSAQNIPAEFWTVPDLAEWIYHRFDVVYESPTSYHFLLHQAGLSYHRPETTDQRKPAPGVVEARMRELDEQLETAYQDDTAIVVAADEVRIEHEAIVRRAWCKTGQPSVLKVDRRRKAQSYVGFLDQKQGGVSLYRLPHQNSETIIEPLTKLVAKHPGKTIHVVWDNAAWHRSRMLREQLGPGGRFENVRLYWLPAYSPEHNPIEKVWGEAKNSIANQQRASFETTRQAFEGYINSNTFGYRLKRF